MRCGLIARMDCTGVGQGQTLRLAKLLKPDRVMVIDSTRFNGNVQHPAWYSGFNSTTVYGFPNDLQVRAFLSGLDVVISAETFYHNNFTTIARAMGVKTILIANPEFCDWFKPHFQDIPLPDKVIVPSYWRLDEMQQWFNAEYLPTPIFEYEFEEARKVNLKRKARHKYLFLNGKTAVHDRNGLECLYAALEFSTGNFTITVKAQNDVMKHPDPRLTYDFSNPENQAELYKDFDALILPRRYGGQALSMTEALQSALPVIMPEIDPNNKVLPGDWLVPAYKKGEFMTRTIVDIYNIEPAYLAHKLDTFRVTKKLREQAYKLGKQYDAETLRGKYQELIA